MAYGKYDPDEWDDGYGDDYDDDYGDDYDEVPSKPKQAAAAPQSKGKAAAPKPAAAAGASSLAQCLCDPPPLRPDGKPQRGVKKSSTAAAKQQEPFPVAPAPAAGRGAHAPQAFGFNTPSPDEVARAAGPAARPAAGVFLAPSKTPTYKQQQQQLKQEQQQAGAASASTALAGMQLRDGDGGPAGAGPGAAAAAAAAAATGSSGGSKRRPFSEYQMEPALAKQVAVANAAEASGTGAGGRQRLHLVVLGHVDAGKSTLMGRLLHDLGLVSQKEAHKNQREAAAAGKASFAWAWVLDERPEERSRGVTVDVAMARFATPRHTVTLLDAPGHRDFVPNMIGGAAQADAALLVVDGSTGGFESGFIGDGQTREHAQLARSLGVEQLAVVVTKLDSVDYSKERFDYIVSQLLPFLKTCGYKEAALQFLPAVGPAGENLTGPPTAPQLAAWWRGPSLTGAIDAFTPLERATAAPLRLPVHDVVPSAKGVMLGGKLASGAVAVGSKVVVAPSGEAGVVKTIEVDGQPAQLARAGDSADITIAGVEANVCFPGCMLCPPAWLPRIATRVEARVLVLDVPIPILKGQQVVIHAHTAQQPGTICGLLAVLDPKTGQPIKSKPRCLLKGQTALIEVSPARPLCVEQYGDMRSLGRLALREGGRTLAVGVITAVTQEQ